MKRGIVVTVAGAAVLVAGLSGCSMDDNKPAATTRGATTTSAAATTTSAAGGPSATAGAGTAKVTIDGQAQNVQGQVVCATAGGNMNIAIGEAMTGIAAVLSADGSTVQSVGLGNVNGVTLGYTQGVPGGANATATKDGNTYKISGTATGVDMANPMQPVTKPFEIQVTCPSRGSIQRGGALWGRRRFFFCQIDPVRPRPPVRARPVSLRVDPIAVAGGGCCAGNRPARSRGCRRCSTA